MSPSAYPIDCACLFDAIPVPATLIDADGTIVDVNQAFLESTRRVGEIIQREDRIGKSVVELASPDVRSEWEAYIGEVLGGSQPEPRRWISAGGSGVEFMQGLHARAVRGADGSVEGAVVLYLEATEPTHQARQLEESARFLEAYQGIGELVLSSLDLEAVLDRVSQEIVRAGIFRSLMFALVDEEQESIEVVRNYKCERDARGEPIPGSLIEPIEDVIGLRYSLDDANITAQVARTGQMAVLEGTDPRFDPRVWESAVQPKVSYFFPVTRGDRTLAVMATGSTPEQKEQTLERIRAMRNLLNQVAIALEHAHLYQQIRASERSTRVNLAIQRVRNRILEMEIEADWEKVVTSLGEELTSLVDFAGCGVNLVSQDGRMRSYSSGRGAQVGIEMETPPPVRTALSNGEPFYRRNLGELEEAEEYDGLFQIGIRSVVDVPFTTGTIAMNSLEEDAFTPEDIAVLQAFAETMSQASQRLHDLRALSAKEDELRQAQKMETVGLLTAGVAHNFNNMLQGIVSNLELARIDAGQDIASLIGGAMDTAGRATEVVQELLSFSRGNRRAELGPVDVTTIIHDTEAMCSRSFARDIRVVVEPCSSPPVLGDALLLQQVFLNLCINARDALEESGQSMPTIRLRWEVVETQDESAAPEVGACVRIDVIDNGPGMDNQTRDRVFDPFFTTKPVGKGTGLGLSTADGIVRDCGGWIECASAPGLGSRFSVFLPAALTVQPPAEESLPVAGTRGSETVLIVDDEPAIRHTAQRMLQLRGYSVLVAGDGQEGLDIFRRHRDDIDVVLLDQSMPQLSGRDVLRKIRKEMPQVSVIIVTGFPASMDDFEGATGIIQKPFTLAKLVSSVREVLDRAAGADA